VLGLVPDQLRVLAEDPAIDLPGIRGVFTWGERLPPTVAERWRGYPQAKIRELLISTEYWLSLYAAPLEDGGRYMRVIGGTKLLVLADDNRPAGKEEVGELLLAGPMVTSGYVHLCSSPAENATEVSSSQTPFRQIGGTRYFCTRDLVRVVHSGHLEFRGRADMTTKEKGKWVDLLAVEEAIRAVNGVESVAVLPDPKGAGEHHAYVVLKEDAEPTPAATVAACRKVLLRAAQVHILAHLPRHPVTKKVDLGHLRSLAKGHGESWPLTPEAPAPDYVLARAREKQRDHIVWTVAAAAIASSWDLQSL